jgi:hypothetical protein
MTDVTEVDVVNDVATFESTRILASNLATLLLGFSALLDVLVLSRFLPVAFRCSDSLPFKTACIWCTDSLLEFDEAT